MIMIKFNGSLFYRNIFGLPIKDRSIQILNFLSLLPKKSPSMPLPDSKSGYFLSIQPDKILVTLLQLFLFVMYYFLILFVKEKNQ